MRERGAEGRQGRLALAGRLWVLAGVRAPLRHCFGVSATSGGGKSGSPPQAGASNPYAQR